MCDIWAKLPQVNDYKWGEYKCPQEIGKNFYNEILEKYPYVSHLWLHSKDMKEEWMGEINKDNEYSISTWILNDVREKINEWK
jgi:hypothetical protein